MAFVERLAEGYDALFAGRFGEAFVELQVAIPSHTPAMAAERAYLAALCGLELQTNEGIEVAITLLRQWRPREPGWRCGSSCYDSKPSC